MINREKTKVKYGYFPEDLAQNSESKVVWSCDKCSAERTYTYSYYLKKRDVSFEKHEGHELCQKCSHSHRVGHTSKLETTKYPAIELPKEVNIEETIKIFGHDPQKMSPWSRGYVILNCSCCNKETETRRCSLNTYKSILETGKFKCTGCWTKERRQGVKASEETKNKQKSAQQKRRNKEKIQDIPVPQTPQRFAAVAGDPSPRPYTPNSGQVIQFPKKPDEKK